MEMEKNLTTVILAAGKGKRMNNPEKSKVMFELDGRPMIGYVVELALSMDSNPVIPVVGHQKQEVMDYLTLEFNSQKDKIIFAHQDEQLGTGHAVMQTKEILSGFDGDVLILSGDVPLLTKTTLIQFIDFHRHGKYTASLISAIFDEPHGYGRIIRDENIEFVEIVEEKDATEEEKRINEINSGIYLVDCKFLFDALKNVNTQNAQGEYYLTDIFENFAQRGLRIGADPVFNNYEITGVNTLEQLKELENIYKSIQS
jgi:UDP-N-acetylglucosamine diphosphorylase/glucosamine-1-phosphate N-acetyltransferase